MLAYGVQETEEGQVAKDGISRGHVPCINTSTPHSKHNVRYGILSVFYNKSTERRAFGTVLSGGNS